MSKDNAYLPSQSEPKDSPSNSSALNVKEIKKAPDLLSNEQKDFLKIENPNNTQIETVNSEKYWTNRFNTNWDANGGACQSLFFYSLALEHMPSAILNQIKMQKLSVCDWGCATGDGTNLLSKSLDTEVVGIDFSSSAINIAQSRYKQPKFITINLLEEDLNIYGLEKFDILFSSNTLEHFRHPWFTLKHISKAAKRMLILLLPFREFNLFTEHEYTFTENNIPFIISDDFVMVYSKIIETSLLVPTYWTGSQIIIIYIKKDYISSDYVLSDLRFEISSTNPSKT